MPHRLLDLPPFFVHALEALGLGFAFGWSLMAYYCSIISNEDWDRILGPNGVAVVAVGAVGILWFNKVSSDKERAKALKEQEAKEDARRQEEEINKEKRHAETLAASHEYAYQMKALAVESMKVTMKVDHTLSELTSQLRSRPCQAATLKPQFDDR